ncbi:MAG: hypothetical protein HQL76_14425 [Magnetococcales bacterium]|nr:hypothetical protein [Magnetococcales bacterium]
MAVLIIFQNGSMDDAFQFRTVMPEVHRFAAKTGRGLLLPTKGSAPVMSWVMASMLFPEDSDTLFSGPDLPRGYLAALGTGLAPEPSQTWAVLSLTHLRRHQDRLVFVQGMPAPVDETEHQALVASLRAPFADLGWTIHGMAGREAILSTTMECPVTVASLDEVGGRSLLEVLPRGDKAGHLLQVLTTGQMILARARINQERVARGSLVLNTPWIHGIGTGVALSGRDNFAGTRGFYFGDDPVGGGLARMAGWKVMDPGGAQTTIGAVTPTNPWPTDMIVQAARSGPVLLQCSVTSADHLRRTGHETVRHLGDALAAARLGLLLLAEERMGRHENTNDPASIEWGYSRGRQLSSRQWFWNRRTWGKGPTMAVEQGRELWLT